MILKELLAIANDQQQILCKHQQQMNQPLLMSFHQQSAKTVLLQNQNKIQSLIKESEYLLKQKHVNEDKIQNLEYLGVRKNDKEQDKAKYIEELEQQLQEIKKQLLEKKIQITNKDDEIVSLRRQLQSIGHNFQSLEEQKKDINDLVIKVSQELRNKEFDLHDYNYQVSSEKDLLARQVELLKKELLEEKQRNQRLEVLESDLIHKADVKDNDLINLKAYMSDMEQKLMVKSEAIEKAQQIIEKLNDEFGRVTKAMSKTESERDNLRGEVKESTKRNMDLNKQLQQMQAQHQMNQQHVSAQLKKEIDELKEALRQYQQQYDDEKRMLSLNLREANEEKYKLHIEKEKNEMQLKKQITGLQVQQEEQLKLHNEKITQMHQEFKEQKESLEHVLANREEQSQSQINYLHKRIKEISSQEYSRNVVTGKSSYLEALKQEFSALASELLDTRTLIKNQSLDQNAAGITSKMKVFEEFKSKVLNQLEEWDIKAEGLASLSKRYEKELDEQKQMFTQMRQMLKDKDALIANVQKQVRMRDQAKDAYVSTVKKELERQTYLIKGELIDIFKVTQHSTLQERDENLDLQSRFKSFKEEFVQLLEEKDSIIKDNYQLQGDVKRLIQDKEILTHDKQEILSYLRELLSPLKTSQTYEPKLLLQEMETVAEELKIRREEVMSYRSQLAQLQEQNEQDKKFMQGKLQAVEDQLFQIQRQNLTKEEEQQVNYLQKETKYMNEVQKALQELQSTSAQLQTRERQLKKLQITNDEKDSQITHLQNQISENNQKIEDLIGEGQDMESKLDQMTHEQDEKEQQTAEKQRKIEELGGEIGRLEERLKFLRDSLKEREQELQRERELNLVLQDEKYQAMNFGESFKEKCSLVERENQNLYKDLVQSRESLRDQRLNLEQSEFHRVQLQKTCEQMTDMVTQIQEEVGQSQREVEQLNTALEVVKRKYNKAKELKHQLRLMKANEKQLQDIIEAQKWQLHPAQGTVGVQTDNVLLHDLLVNHEDFQVYQQQLLGLQRDYEMLQEAINQRNKEIDRLISEKRDLEELVDQQNQSIKQIRLNNGSFAFESNNQMKTIQNNSYKENLNVLNSSTSGRDHNLYSKILNEKENYIMRLEQEISDMRKDAEVMKDKLINYEIGNLSHERSLGGGPGLMPVNRSQQMSQFKNPMMPQRQNLHMTHNSLQMQHPTSGTIPTNYQTIPVDQHQSMYSINNKSINKSIHNF